MAFKNNNTKNTKNAAAAGGHGKCCNSDTKMWKAIQATLKSNDMEAWAQLAGDEHRVPQLAHVLVKSRVENDVRRMSPSQRHQLLQFNKDVRGESMRLFGVSVKDLNAVQVALFHGNEEIACQVVRFVSEHATANELRLFLNHTWGYRNTSLHLAAFFGMPTLVQLLLELGADPMVINRKNMAPADCCAGNDACLALLCPDLLQEEDVAKDDNVMADLVPTAVTMNAHDVSNETPAMSEDDSDSSDDDELVADTIITPANTFTKDMVTTSKDLFTEIESWQPIESSNVVSITWPPLYDNLKTALITDMALSEKDLAEVVSWYTMESTQSAIWPIMDDGDGCKTALLREMTLSDDDIAEVVSWHQVHDNNAAAITWPVMDDGDGSKTALLQEMALSDDDIAEIVSWHQVQDNHTLTITWPIKEDDTNHGYKTAFFADTELPGNGYIKSLQDDIDFVPDLAKMFALAENDVDFVPDLAKLFALPKQDTVFVPDLAKLFALPEQQEVDFVPDLAKLFALPEQEVDFVPDLAKLFALPDAMVGDDTMAITHVKPHVSTSLEPSGDLEAALNLDFLFGAEDPCLSAASCKQSDGPLHDTSVPISISAPMPSVVVSDHGKVPETKSDMSNGMLILDCQESGDTSPTVVHSGKAEYHHMASSNDQTRTPSGHITSDNDAGLHAPITCEEDTSQDQPIKRAIHLGGAVTRTSIIEYDNSLGALCGGTTFAKGSAISDLVTMNGDDGATPFADLDQHVSCVPFIDTKDTQEHHYEQCDIDVIGDTASKSNIKMHPRALVKQDDDVNIPEDPDAIDHVALSNAMNHSDGSYDTSTTTVSKDSSDTTDWPNHDGATKSKHPMVDKDSDTPYQQHATPPLSIGRNATSPPDDGDGGCPSAIIHAACFKITPQHQHYHHPPTTTRWQDSSTLYTHSPTGKQSSDTTFHGEHSIGDGDDCSSSIHRRDYKDTTLVGFKCDNDPHAVLHGRIFSSCDTWPSIDHHGDSRFLKHPKDGSRPIVHPSIHPAWVAKPDLANSTRNDCLAPDDGSWCTFNGASPPGNKEPLLDPPNDAAKSLKPLLDPGSDISLKNRYDSGGGGQGSQHWIHDPYLMLHVATILSEQLVQVVNQLGMIDSSSAIRYEVKDSFPMSAVRGQAVAVS